MRRSGPGHSLSAGEAELSAPEAPRGPVSRRVLLLVPFTPRMDAHHGGSRAIAQIIGALSAGHTVAVVYLRGRDEPAMEEVLQARCDLVREVRHTHPQGAARLVRRLRVALAPLRGMPTWAAWWAVEAYATCVREIAAEWRPDIVQLEFHLMGQYLPALRECRAPRVLVQHDPGSGSQDTSRLGRWQGLLAPLDRRAWRRYEATIMRQVDAVVVFTERDRAALTPLAPDTRIVRIPLGTPLPAEPLDPVGAATPTLLFVGSFAHGPNLDAALRLADHILPRVRASRPEVTLVLVGSDPPLDLHRRADSHVELAASVPDVTPYLARASLVVVPLRLGGGMRVKVLEAMAAGKAVVASRLAVEGLEVHDGRECWLAETDEEFASRILRLLDDDQERRRLGAEARSWAVEHLSWSRVAAAYDRLYQTLLKEPPKESATNRSRDDDHG
jgi:polysaccharide biosynthesis protein PslH